MSSDERDFNNIETRAVIKYFFFLQGKAPKEIHAILKETLGEHAPSYATVKNWVAQFKHGDFSTCDAPRPGRPKTVTTPEIIDQIHQLILENRRISAKPIAEQLVISRERVEFIIYEDLDMRKLSVKWVPKCLNADEKHQRASRLRNFLEFLVKRVWKIRRKEIPLASAYNQTTVPQFSNTITVHYTDYINEVSVSSASQHLSIPPH